MITRLKKPRRRPAKRPRKFAIETLEGRRMLDGQPEMVIDIIPGSRGGFETFLNHDFTSANGTAFFIAYDNFSQTHLWKSDGTEAGSIDLGLLKPQGLAAVDNAVFFAGTNDPALQGWELWRSDGTLAGTALVKDINLGGAFGGGSSSSPTWLTNVNGTLYFAANDGVYGNELWKSDGTAAGTVMVKDIFLGPPGNATHSNPTNLVNVNGTLYFTANDGINGPELWKSDGTLDGTVLVKNISPGTSQFDIPPTNLTNVNGTLFFTANDGASGQELWKSDGTAAGTVMVSDIASGFWSSDPQSLIAIGSTLYFSASVAPHGRELWKSDGTQAGTILVKDINSVGLDSEPSFLTNFNGTLFFAANNSTDGIELWKSDGTAGGTVLVKNIHPTSSSSPANLTAVGNLLYFTAGDGVSGTELWKSDGTAAGTSLVKDIFLGPGGASIGNLLNANGTLFFSANDGVHGIELWTIAGTPPVTVPGDTNGDTFVDGADFDAWQDNFPKSSGATRIEGDADGDGDIDGADFVAWQVGFSAMPPAAASSATSSAASSTTSNSAYGGDNDAIAGGDAEAGSKAEVGSDEISDLSTEPSAPEAATESAPFTASVTTPTASASDDRPSSGQTVSTDTTKAIDLPASPFVPTTTNIAFVDVIEPSSLRSKTTSLTVVSLPTERAISLAATSREVVAAAPDGLLVASVSLLMTPPPSAQRPEVSTPSVRLVTATAPVQKPRLLPAAVDWWLTQSTVHRDRSVRSSADPVELDLESHPVLPNFFAF